jgi:hypothetical protein
MVVQARGAVRKKGVDGPESRSVLGVVGLVFRLDFDKTQILVLVPVVRCGEHKHKLRLRWASRGPSENWNKHVCFAQRQRDVFIVVVGLVAQAIQRAGVFVVHAPDNPRGHPPPARTFFEVSAVN